MGTSKTEKFNDEQNAIASIAKAMGHPARIAILDYLLKVDACVCGDIVKELPLAQATVSQHLKELKNAGLIKGSIEGTSICYCVDKDALEHFQTYFTGITNQLNKTEKEETKEKKEPANPLKFFNPFLFK